ncbi:hypothetical protein TNCV_1426131 [Trichonephila clavipes]|nr:hypothetical protein TNCV_1426131 [Trichonephila clavipes]
MPQSEEVSGRKIEEIRSTGLVKAIKLKGQKTVTANCHNFEHHAGGSTILLGFIPILRENTVGGQGHPTSLPLPPTSREVTRRLFRVPPCLKGTIYLQTSMPSPGFELRPYGTAVPNLYTRWEAFYSCEQHYVTSIQDVQN